MYSNLHFWHKTASGLDLLSASHIIQLVTYHISFHISNLLTHTLNPDLESDLVKKKLRNLIVAFLNQDVSEMFLSKRQAFYFSM